MTAAATICKWAKSLRQVSGYRFDPSDESLIALASCEAWVGKTDPAIIAAVDQAAALWVSTGTLCFLEKGNPELTAEQEVEATAMICAKATVIHQAAYAVWVLETDGVLTGSFHSETPDLAFLLVWKKTCPAAEGWNDDRLRDELLEMINSQDNL